MNKSVARKRLANKVIWALDDITTRARDVDVLVRRAQGRADVAAPDPALLIYLAKLSEQVTKVAMLAIALRQGEYAGARHFEEDTPLHVYASAALDEIVTHAAQGQVAWEGAQARAEERYPDPALLIYLARIRQALADVNVLAFSASQGEYAGEAIDALLVREEEGLG